MQLLLNEFRHNPILWLLALVPVLFAIEKLKPDAQTLLFVVLVTNNGWSAWFVGALVLMAYLIFAMALYLPPPGVH